MNTFPPPGPQWPTPPGAAATPPPGQPSGPAPGHGLDSGRPVRATGYWIGALLMVVGVALGVSVVALGISRAVDALTFPDVVDASGGVWIDDPGGHVIFVVGPVRAANQFVPIPNIVVTDPDGTTVATAPYGGSRSTTGVDASGMRREAVAVATFEASEAGRYHLSASDLEYGSTLGVGEGVDGNFGWFALGGVAGGLAVLGGLVVVVVTAVRRHRSPPMPPGGGYGYGYGYAYPYPYPGAPYPAPGSLAPPAMPARPPGFPATPPGHPPQPSGYPTAPPGRPVQPPWSVGDLPSGGPAGAPPWPGSGSAGPGAWWTDPSSGPSPGRDGGGPTDEDRTAR